MDKFVAIATPWLGTYGDNMVNALDPAHPRPVPCEFVPPLTG
ncbi:hypothetical protein [Nocardia tengchongensis]